MNASILIFGVFLLVLAAIVGSRLYVRRPTYKLFVKPYQPPDTTPDYETGDDDEDRWQ